MVRVTESAVVLLQEIASNASTSAVTALRLVSGESGGYELALEQPHKDDEVVEHEGMPVLHVASDLALALRRSSIVCQTSPEVRLLMVTTPQPYPFGPLTQVVAAPR